jgi:hypothetical protein
MYSYLTFTRYLDAAGITYYQVVSGAFAANVSKSTCFTMASEPHFDSSTTSNPASYPNAMKTFVLSGGNFLAECHGIFSYENLNGGIQYPQLFSHKNAICRQQRLYFI